MRRPEFLPIVAGHASLGCGMQPIGCGRTTPAFTLSAAERRPNGLADTESARSRSPPNGRQPQSPEPLAEAHHKSWKELARSKADGKSDKQVLTFSPWSACGALAVVVGLILVLARLFRRHAPIFSQSLPQEALEILGRRHVDPRQTILLVRIGARILVVGSSANGLNPLGQIDDPVEVDLLAGLCRRGSQAGAWSTSFFRLLKGETKTRPGANSVRDRSRSRHIPRLVRSPTSARPMQPLEPDSEDLSQPEHDLIRRLRGTTASVHADSDGGPAVMACRTRRTLRHALWSWRSLLWPSLLATASGRRGAAIRRLGISKADYPAGEQRAPRWDLFRHRWQSRPSARLPRMRRPQAARRSTWNRCSRPPDCRRRSRSCCS